MGQPLRYGVIGFGYWGPNLVRAVNGADASVVRIVCERDPKRRALAEKLYPGIRAVADPEEVMRDSDIDVVAIATPVSTHFPLAREALLQGKHVFVEKPLASSSAESAELLRLAGEQGRQIFVDHTFVYTGAVRKLAELARSDHLGRILYYDSVRVNLGLFQSDVNVIWDLVVHDLAILEQIMPEAPIAVSAVASNPLDYGPESIAYVSVHYPREVVAHIHASWLAPVKVRQTLIGGTKRMVVYNDLEPTEKIKIYDRGVEVVTDPAEAARLKVGYRAGDILSPLVDQTEALAVAAKHANECFLEDRPPITDAKVGHRVVTVLEAAARSAREGGSRVKLEWE
jgi:predicted dehydrogenase